MLNSALATLFISYAHEDMATACAIQRVLVTAGLRCWRDKNDLRPGDVFAAEIAAAIRQCDAFILLLSAASNAPEARGGGLAHSASTAP